MHRAAQLSRRVAPLCTRNHAGTSLAFSSSSHLATAQPNPRLHLDPSLQALLQDVDMALHSLPKRHKQPPRELEVVHPTHIRGVEPMAEDFDQEEHLEDIPRKSPAALFGSQRIGAVVLPLELQDTIQRLISHANKPQIHSDAKRLFHKEDTDGDKWDLQHEKEYRTRLQAVKHAKRDATAFASVALPAHYSAIFAVLDHVKRRLGPTWHVERVLDWGAGAGSALWASLHSLQPPTDVENAMEGLRVADSTVKCYIGIEKRNGLTEVGRRLFRDIQPEHIAVSWQKGWRQEDSAPPSEGHNTVALSAFLLTTLRDNQARKKLVQEIWDSGANTIILIDHNSKEGFEAIAGAREYLLSLGRQEASGEDDSPLTGSHVVAPCPHDGTCPLYFPGSIKLVCGFSQRTQRPEFVRRTKHSTIGHEDMEYSYVVIRRGPRPQITATGLGRIGAVGKWALGKEASKSLIRELQVHGKHEQDTSLRPEDVDHNALPSPTKAGEDLASEELREVLRLEAYQWPRLVFPPLKRSGHVIIDGCTAEGKIMRMTIPKSQGKQPFYDARKSSWGDIFPHPPKNKPQERVHVLKPGSSNVPGSDIGKRRGSDRSRDRTTYEDIAKDLRAERKLSQRDKRQPRDFN